MKQAVNVTEDVRDLKTSYSYVQYHCTGTMFIGSAKENDYNHRIYKRVIGQLTPGYTDLVKANKLIPPTNWTHFEASSEGWHDFHFRHIAGNSCNYQTNFGLDTMLSLAVIDEWVGTSGINFDELVQQSAAKIYEAGYDGLTFIAELKETVSMLLGAGKKLLSLLKGKETLEGSWLEYRYGWRTLYFDLCDIADNIRNFDEERKRYSERTGTSILLVKDLSWATTWEPATVYTTSICTLDISARGSVVADIRPPRVRFNPAATAWELVTLSFVVDWFISIGQWISSLSFLLLQREHYGSAGVRVAYNRETTGNGYTANPGWEVQKYQRTATSHGLLRKRWPLSVPLLPQPKIDLDTGKLLDLLALVFQAFRSKRTS